MTVDPTFDSIFDDLIDGDDSLYSFMEIIRPLMADCSIFLQSDSGNELLSEPSFVPPVDKDELIAEARRTDSLVSTVLTGGEFCYVMLIGKLNIVLLVVFSKDFAGEKGRTLFFRNTLSLALIKQEHAALVADKEQALKEINVFKQQHGKLIEDNYRQYNLNQEREKEYARKLESEIAKQTAELREANVRLEEISRLKSDFLANMSHELRTPMNAIIGFSELLAETKLDAEQADYTRTIVSSAGSLLSLINDILDLAKIEAGKMELENVICDLPEVVHNVTAMFKIPARDKNVEITCEIDDRIPRKIIGDGNRLRQVLINLAGNSMKFTEKGRIDIKLDYEMRVGRQIMVRFSVQDTGIGIPADRVEAIFDKFTQADGSTTRKFGGTGLGLAICQQLVGLMGGTLKVASEYGKGSTFYFVLPFEEASETMAAPAPEQAPEHVPAESGRILLVDDNAVNQRLASIIIAKLGYEVEVAGDGLEALELLKIHDFDLVLMDIQMPNMDGMTATRKVREIEADPQLRRQYQSLNSSQDPLPVLGLTAHVRKEDEEACYAAGMNGFLTKPIIKKKLAEILAEKLAGRQ
ncbi:MAG: ATP-binding protein [Desulfobulbaceae bacterium]|nr:ATP-binding protein [Desulfobulbaceae bacterium]HIJ79713.1 response regulator [Deltaproteobacteria bacterium]